MGQSMPKAGKGLGSDNCLIRGLAHNCFNPTTLKTHRKKYQLVNFDSDSKALVDHHRRISPWWRVDESGNLVLTIKVGLRTLEFEKGKTGIAVGAPERLESVLDTLIAATRAGELDRFLESPTAAEGRSIPKTKKAA